MKRIPQIEELKKQDFSHLLDADYQEKLKVQKGLYHWLKRTLDILFAVMLFVLFSPLWLVLVVLVRIDSRGKAVFSHERVGKNGKIFTLYKFRTMHQDVNEQDFAPLSKDDARVTRIGKFLRRTSLDEMPQFWNIMKGDMTFVGPRPEMPFIVEKYTPLQKTRLLVKPGLTGLWQVAGRKDLPLNENIEFDLYYMEHESLPTDLIILWKTISVVITGKGAY